MISQHENSLTDIFSKAPPGLIEEICEGDRMFKGNKEAYLSAGLSALKCIRTAMLAAGLPGFSEILDFPSGHGRVLRYLKAEFPNARLTACDIEIAAANFCERAFGAVKAYGHEDPWKIKLPAQYRSVPISSGSVRSLPTSTGVDASIFCITSAQISNRVACWFSRCMDATLPGEWLPEVSHSGWIQRVSPECRKITGGRDSDT